MQPSGGVVARARAWVGGWGFKQWRRAALIAVLVATAGFGGLDTVNKQVTDLKPGEQFDTGRFEITVQRASLVDDVKAGERVLVRSRPGRTCLGVLVTVRNHSTLPGAVHRAVDLMDLPEAGFLTSLRSADGTATVRLGPGLTDELFLVWDLPVGALSVGSRLSLRLPKEVRKTSATYSQGWVPSETDYGRLDVPVGGPR